MSVVIDFTKQVASIKVSDVVFREDLYPRIKPNPQKIQEYSENIEALPAIEINQNNILIDGFHRWKAHQTVAAENIKAETTQTKSEEEVFRLSVERNAKHGYQLEQADKRKIAAKWFDLYSAADICQWLSIPERTFRRWTDGQRQARQEETNNEILELYLRCYGQQEIADKLNLVRQTVTDQIAKIADFAENGQMAKSGKIGNFEDSEFNRQIYTVWNFPKATNTTRHFGNIPPEIVENLLYLYTKPFDVVFDPFGGGGSTLDMCRKRMRRCYISDLTPIPAREHEIRHHDITIGLPDDLPSPALVFLDPPYWQQAKEKYSNKQTDLANIGLDQFLDQIGDIAKSVKRKWTKNKTESCHLALIIGPCKENGTKIDLPFMCCEKISKYMKLKERVIVPYSTQVHGGAYVNMAKEKRELLYLHRDLMVFSL